MTRTKKRFFNEVKCEIQPKRGGNNVDGKTVVASCDLKRGEIVCYVCGEIYNSEEEHYSETGKFHGVKIPGLYEFKYHGRNMSIDPEKHISGIINHSCEPTCRLQWNDTEKITEIRTKRRLSKGEEITINYSRGWFENHDVECNCGCDPSKCYGYRYQEEDESETDTKQIPTSLVKCAKEGKKIENNINRYSRDKELRNTVIEEQGCKCVVCGTCLEDIYGDIAENFIHVHHIVPLSRGKGRPKKVSADDLVPICPNCHAVLHHHFSNPNKKSIEEMKHIVKAQRRKTK